MIRRGIILSVSDDSMCVSCNTMSTTHSSGIALGAKLTGPLGLMQWHSVTEYNVLGHDVCRSGKIIVLVMDKVVKHCRIVQERWLLES